MEDGKALRPLQECPICLRCIQGSRLLGSPARVGYSIARDNLGERRRLLRQAPSLFALRSPIGIEGPSRFALWLVLGPPADYGYAFLGRFRAIRYTMTDRYRLTLR